jgi:hypothetical protein
VQDNVEVEPVALVVWERTRLACWRWRLASANFSKTHFAQEDETEAAVNFAE